VAEFAFDPVAHRYTLDGKTLPSVTQVLRLVDNFDSIPAAILENARARGERLHQAINLFNRDELDWESLDDETRDGVKAWARFLDESGAVVIASETPIYHPTLRYAGTPDVVLEWKRGIAIPDVKGSYTIPRTVGPQTAAYAEAWTHQPYVRGRAKRYCIHIKGDTYNVVARNDPSDWAIFQSCLNIYRYMEAA